MTGKAKSQKNDVIIIIERVKKMLLKGVGASAGASMAQIYYVRNTEISVEKLEGRDPETEMTRFKAAKEKAMAELDDLYEKMAEKDSAAAQIFDIHKYMLDDPDFCDGVENAIAAGLNAEFAVKSSADALSDFLSSLENEVMRARAADIKDAADRLIRLLMGVQIDEDEPDTEVIVAAEDLLPSQTVRLDRKKVLGFVTKHGSVTSHSAILAKTMGIPCVVGMGDDFDLLPKKGEIAVDGNTGEVFINMSESEKEAFKSRIEEFQRKKSVLEKFKYVEAVTKSGHKVKVCANIGGITDADSAIAFGADGVGLFRSEFLYLESDDFPGEEKQFEVYKTVLEKMAPRDVVIRTLDIGSDKQIPYLGIPNEENPALGYRAIRICLKEPSVFHTQLCALLRASVYGRLQVMFPMITHLDQIRRIKEHIAKAKADLDARGMPYSNDIQFGIMIETPAAAIMSDVFAKEVDFFSIGTNDLTQYTLAADRMNAKIKDIFDPGNEAVLRLIEMTAKNAHKNGIWVGICGESAGDTSLIDFYMSLKIDELSVSPYLISEVKKAIIESGA